MAKGRAPTTAKIQTSSVRCGEPDTPMPVAPGRHEDDRQGRKDQPGEHRVAKRLLVIPFITILLVVRIHDAGRNERTIPLCLASSRENVEPRSPVVRCALAMAQPAWTPNAPPAPPLWPGRPSGPHPPRSPRSRTGTGCRSRRFPASCARESPRTPRLAGRSCTRRNRPDALGPDRPNQFSRSGGVCHQAVDLVDLRTIGSKPVRAQLAAVGHQDHLTRPLRHLAG